MLKKNSTLSMLALQAQDNQGSRSKNSKEEESNYLDDPVYEINRLEQFPGGGHEMSNSEVQQLTEEVFNDSLDSKGSPSKRIGKINIQNKKSTPVTK